MTIQLNIGDVVQIRQQDGNGSVGRIEHIHYSPYLPSDDQYKICFPDGSFIWCVRAEFIII